MKYIYTFVVALALISSCTTPNDPDYDADYQQIKSMEIKDAIELANEWKYSRTKIKSFITPKELKVVFPDKREITIALPSDEMYVAVAPYINETHTCATHYLSSCQGEMTKKIFAVTIKDDKQQVIYDGSITSLDNGFFELWLPRNKSFTCSVEYNNLKTEIMLETFEDSKTCITTGRLK